VVIFYTDKCKWTFIVYWIQSLVWEIWNIVPVNKTMIRFNVKYVQRKAKKVLILKRSVIKPD